MARTGAEIKEAVREHYGERARNVASSCCGSGELPDSKAALYRVEDVADLPDTVPSYGCGNPTAIAGMKAGEVVLDLGSGPGLDCFLSAKQVGETGRVIGLDMTQDMLDLANANRDKLKLKNVEFRKGEMEAMPVDSSSVDVIISNCVINLSPDKDAVFAEAFRVLKPGGRLHVSDPVLSRELNEEEQSDLASWAGCRAGALMEPDYLERLKKAGFAVARVDSRTPYEDKAWYSATISAYKAGAVSTNCC